MSTLSSYTTLYLMRPRVTRYFDARRLATDRIDHSQEQTAAFQKCSRMCAYMQLYRQLIVPSPSRRLLQTLEAAYLLLAIQVTGPQTDSVKSYNLNPASGPQVRIIHQDLTSRPTYLLYVVTVL